MIYRTLTFLVINFAALGLGSLLTNIDLTSDWYLNLNKAPWTPPAWTFGLAWTSMRDPFPSIRFIAVKKSGRIIPVPIQEIRFIKADGHYTELHLQQSKKELSDKSLEQLEVLLPSSFLRIHRSYIVQMNEAVEIKKFPGSKYLLLLKDDTTLPIGRSKLKNVEARML